MTSFILMNQIKLVLVIKVEIVNLLIHLTDSSQNTLFQDKYFSGIHFDISKSIFVFSFNDIEKVNKIYQIEWN